MHVRLVVPGVALAATVALAAACAESAAVPVRETTAAVRCAAYEAARGVARPVRAYPELSFVAPVQVVADPAASAVFVVELLGAVKRFDDRPDASEAPVAVDLSDLLFRGSQEDGLLGFALERRAEGVSAVVKLTMRPLPGRSGARVVVGRVRSDDDGRTFRRESFEEILSVAQPGAVHRGGAPAFGRDGMLYVPIGDGTWDEPRPSQDLASLSGKVLRLDVSVSPYVAPPDNPFVSVPGARPEIWALGLRNPHGWSFDPEDGSLWVGDVGFATWEEMDHVVRGGNYGWPLREGRACRVEPCVTEGLVEPLYTYPTMGGAAIVGGPVYDGPRLPSLRGRVLLGDYSSGRLEAVSRATGESILVDETGLAITSIALDARGEVLVTDGNGRLFTLEPKASGRVVPPLLSETGCVDVRRPRQAAPGLFGYEVNMPLWSDGTEKARSVSLPPGAKLRVLEDLSFEAPVGTVAVKTFFWKERPIETRLFVRHGDGAWGGYSYAWRPDGQDAELLEHAKVADVDGLAWQFPSRSQCLACHTESAGRTLGLDIAQLNLDVSDGRGGVENQLARLEREGLVAPLGGIDLLPRFPHRDDPSADDSAWSRAYLHANCSHCHRPGAPGRGDANFLATAATSSAGCDKAPEVSDLGIEGARVIVPGAPDASLLFLRTSAEGEARMPPLGTTVVDSLATRRFASWIAGMTTCEPPL